MAMDVQLVKQRVAMPIVMFMNNTGVHGSPPNLAAPVSNRWARVVGVSLATQFQVGDTQLES